MSIFFDATYYLQNNPDVLAAVARGETTAEQHFNTFGWKEGRNPNETFDVNFYLISNPDVLAAGVNPLTHFIQFGAAEGRSPSEGFVTFADFDTTTYAANNPDLAAAGLVTPAQLYAHFATFGFAENRAGVQTMDGTPIAGDLSGGTTLTLTWDLDQFTGTNANDLFQGMTYNIGAFDSINGGAGTDTLNLFGNLDDAEGTGTKATSLEIVNITDNSSDVDAAYFGASVEQIWQINDLGYIFNVGETTTAGFRNVGYGDVEYTGTVGNVALDNVYNGFELWSYGEITTLNISGSLEQDSDPAVVEYLELHDHTNDRSIETLNLSLSTGTEIRLYSGEFDSLTTFDASASTGGIEFSTNDGDNVVATVLTGSGDDNIYFDQDFSGDGEGGVTVTIDVGAGDDEVSYAAYSNTEATTASITLGDGDDTFFVTEKFGNVVDASENNFADSLITVEDFNVDEDVFDFSDFGFTALETFTTTEATAIANAASLHDALDLAASYMNTESAGYFSYEGDAYLLHDADGSLNFSDYDGLIQLVGVSASDLNSSNFVLTPTMV
jgi:hypothetical protein